MKTVRKADQAKFDKARKAYQNATKRCVIANNSENVTFDVLRATVVAACPWDEGDIVTSSKLRSRKVFRISSICPSVCADGCPGYYLRGHFMKKDGGWYAQGDKISASETLASLVAYAPPAVSPKAPRVKRLEAALERVAAGENIEVVKQSLGL